MGRHRHMFRHLREGWTTSREIHEAGPVLDWRPSIAMVCSTQHVLACHHVKRRRTVGLHLGGLVVAVQVAGVQQHRSHREVERPPLLPHLCAGAAAAQALGTCVCVGCGGSHRIASRAAWPTAADGPCHTANDLQVFNWGFRQGRRVQQALVGVRGIKSCILKESKRSGMGLRHGSEGRHLCWRTGRRAGCDSAAAPRSPCPRERTG